MNRREFILSAAAAAAAAYMPAYRPSPITGQTAFIQRLFSEKAHRILIVGAPCTAKTTLALAIQRHAAKTASENMVVRDNMTFRHQRQGDPWTFAHGQTGIAIYHASRAGRTDGVDGVLYRVPVRAMMGAEIAVYTERVDGKFMATTVKDKFRTPSETFEIVTCT
jgi:hypothetical protein